MKQPDIVIYGLFVADSVAKPVQNLPAPGTLEFVEKIELHTGGCALNTGMAMKKLGANVMIGGKIGSDNYGFFILSKLKEMKLDTKLVRKAEGVNTSATVVAVNRQGERCFMHNYGANATINIKDFDWNTIKKAKYLHIAGTFLMPGFDGDPMAAVLRRAKSMKVKTTVDTAYDPSGQWLKLIEPSLPYIDVFMPSYEEAKAITGREEPESITDFFLDRKMPTIVIKLGDKGCYIRTAERKIRLPAIPVNEVVDTTGAGDAFAAGFLFGLIKKWSLERCGLFANAVGASCVQAVGATAGIKSFSQTQQFMLKSGVKT